MMKKHLSKDKTTPIFQKYVKPFYRQILNRPSALTRKLSEQGVFYLKYRFGDIIFQSRNLEKLRLAIISTT